MTGYPLSIKLYRKFTTLGYSLICKICECPLSVHDDIESKGKEKMYHAKCYEDAHVDINDTTTTQPPEFFNDEEIIEYGKAKEIE